MPARLFSWIYRGICLYEFFALGIYTDKYLIT